MYFNSVAQAAMNLLCNCNMFKKRHCFESLLCISHTHTHKQNRNSIHRLAWHCAVKIVSK